MNRREALRWAAAELSKRWVPDAELDARLLLFWACRISLTDYAMEPLRELSDAQEALYKEAVEKRGRRIPLQYITGEQEFMGIPFLVSPDVLIPRQDTELLAEEALKRIRPGMRLLDLCTGSGCILISLERLAGKKGRADGSNRFVGSDVSPAALAVARENAKRTGAEVALVESDLFEKLTGEFDLIVSNPPYIATEEIGDLQEEVRLYEPFGALDGKADGLYFYRRIVREALGFLKSGGELLLEIGCDQGKAVAGLMESFGYRKIRILPDLAGLDRVVIGRYDI